MPVKKKRVRIKYVKPKINLARTFIEAGAELEKLPLDTLAIVLKSSGNEKMVAMSHLMSQARYDDYTFPELCAVTGVHMKEVVTAFKEHQIAIGTIRQAKHTPDVLESNAVAAKGRSVPCPTCKESPGIFGLPDENGVIPKCQTCNGTAWVMQAGDTNALKILAESSGLTKQSGPLVNINQNFGGAAGSFEDLMRQAEKKPARIIEAVAE